MNLNRLVPGLVLLVLLPQGLARVDPASGRIRLLFVGQWPSVGGRPEYLVEDPLLQTSIVPYYEFGAQLEQIRRYMNLRYPRTLQQLVDNYDIVAFANIQLPAFTARQIQMVADGVRQEGLGYMMSGGHTSFGGTSGTYPTWKGTPIDEILPVDLIDGLYKKPFVFKLVVSDPQNELMASLPWDELPPFTYSLNAVLMRQGGQLLAEAGLPERWPVLAYGDFEKGRCLAFMTPLDTYDNRNLLEWGFFDDMCANMVYFGANVKLPEEPFRIHELRRLYRIYHEERLLFLSVIEFVDRFGANTAKLEERLAKIDAIRASSYRAYVLQDFGESFELMKRVANEIRDGQNEALRIKNLTLAWIYVVEWLAVTATLMGTGSIVWSVMVKRKVYKQVGITRSLPELVFVS